MNAGSTLRAHGAHPKKPGPRLAATCALLLAALVIVLAAACGSTSSSSSAASAKITVFAAASLTDAFTKLGSDYTAAHPGVTVTFNFAGSQDLVAQLQQGAPADVLATADTKSMDQVATLVGAPQVCARNQLEIALPPGNPEHIKSLKDLADPSLKVVLAAPQVPAGKYAQQVLANAGVTVKPVSLEESVKGVVTKVSLGEADAGIVYVTDVQAAGGKIAGVAIPDTLNVIATYPIAVVKATKNDQDARAFVDMVMSSRGRQVLHSFGFLPPSGP
jgi:molybdate transport system substrate-binding protein